MSAIARYRLLVIVLLFASTGVLWELSDPDPEASRRSQVLPYVMLDLYPQSPEILYQKGLLQVMSGNLPAAREQFELALATGDNTNEDLLYYYAVTLIRLQICQVEIDNAIAQWQYHFPHSRRTHPMHLQPRALTSETDR